MKEGDVEITLGVVCASSLLQGTPAEPERSYKIAKELFDGGTVELSVDDIVFIKSRLEESTLGTLLVGQALNLLNV